MNDLSERNALITGASRGIGAAIADALAETGCNLLLCARDGEALNTLATDLSRRYGVRAEWIAVDLSRSQEVERVIERAEQTFSGLDILINNAGVGLMGEVATLDVGELRYLFEVNFFAALTLIQAFVPMMRAQGEGVIVNISSIVSFFPQPLGSGYSATKYALNAMGEAADIELERDGIRVVQVYPGITATSFFQHTRLGGSGRGEEQPFLPGVPASKVARKVVEAIQRGESRVYVSWWDRVIVGIARVAPAPFRIGLTLLTRLRRGRYSHSDEGAQSRGRGAWETGRKIVLAGGVLTALVSLLVRFGRKGKV